MTFYHRGYDNIYPPKIITSQNEKRLVRNVISNELYMPLSSTVALKRKKEMLYVTPDFEKVSKVDALVDSGAYVSAIAQKELDIFKQQALSNILEIDDPPIFQSQMAIGQLEKPIATATLKIDFVDHILAEHIVVMKYLTGPTMVLHSMRHSTVAIDTTHGLIHFPHLTMQIKST